MIDPAVESFVTQQIAALIDSKPRIYRNPGRREWVCSDRYVYASGWGADPEAAYKAWRRRYLEELARVLDDGRTFEAAYREATKHGV